MDMQFTSGPGIPSEPEPAKGTPIANGAEPELDPKVKANTKIDVDIEPHLEPEGEGKGKGKGKGEGEGEGDEGDEGGDKSDIDDTKDTKGKSKVKVTSKAKAKVKSFEGELMPITRRIKKNQGGSYVCKLKIAKDLRRGLKVHEKYERTHEDYRQWALDNFNLGKTSLWNYATVLEIIEGDLKETLKSVPASYMATVDYTVFQILLLAKKRWEKDQKVNRFESFSVDKTGIFFKFVHREEKTDIRGLTTRAAEKELKWPTEPIGDGGSNSPAPDTTPKKHAVGDGDQIKKFKSKYTLAFTKLNRERKVLRQELEASQQREKELEARLNELLKKAATSSEKVAQDA